jgi:carbonic anhydrase/acetyltransferase-like protein (isoleucine patch superfamily)
MLRADHEALQVGQRAIISAQAFLSGKTSIGEDSFVGARSIIQDSTIAKGAVVEPGAILIGVTVPEGAWVPAGSVLIGNGPAFQLLPKDSPWRTMQSELLFAGNSFAQVYATTPRPPELRGANKRAAKKQGSADMWGALFTAEGGVLFFLVLALLALLGFGIRDADEK